MKVNIDEQSGFCFGVKRTIQIAEEILRKDGHLFCLGEIVHNDEEINRLVCLGLETIDHKRFNKLSNTTVLLRSHGEPPETYLKAKQNNIKILEGTCPIVLKLQQKVYNIDKDKNENKTQIIIFGNKNHPEVISLIGQNPESVIVINETNDIKEKIDPDLPVRIYSQTTQNSDKYKKIINEIDVFLKDQNPKYDFDSSNSICKVVSKRNISLSKFAGENDIIIFVGGKNSSNGKMLFEHFKSINVNSFYISKSSEINKSWFKNHSTVGVCGATSTPQWLMNEVAENIRIIE